jgi:hypothetical protein
VRWQFGIVACVLALAPNALASEPLPVYVTVVGSGSVRVLLGAGSATPCDSSANQPLFDGKLEAGTYLFESPSPILCERHTHGAFREVGWSNDRLYGVRRVGPIPPPWRLDIFIDADR